MWKCQCDCGNEKIAYSSYLLTGRTSSCGCLKKEASIKRFTTHGQTRTRLYNIWSSMIQRCCNVNSESFAAYGEKGVSVCNEWLQFDGFYKWAKGNGYQDNLSIDRINCSGNYCPENCQWITLSANREKHRDSIMLNINDEEHPLKTWCDKFGLPTNTVRRFYHKNGLTTTLSAFRDYQNGNLMAFNKHKSLKISKAKAERNSQPVTA